MSQQEFAPGPQSQQPGNEDEIYKPQYPYSWSGNLDSEAAPRDEPPSSYEYNPDAMQQGYQAQDIAEQQPGAQPGAYPDVNSYEYQQPAQQLPPQYQYNPYSNDGDAYQQGYSPYNSSYSNATQNAPGQGVPPWARPQQQPRSSFRFGWLIFLLILFSMGGGLFRSFWIFGHSIGFIFLPIFILMIVASIISRSMWGGGRRGGRRGGPWGW